MTALDDFADVRARLEETPDDLGTYLRLRGLSGNVIAIRVEAARREQLRRSNDVDEY